MREIPAHLEDKPAAEVAAALGCSRQHVYNLRRAKAGLCISCSKPARPGKIHCERHAKRASRHTRASIRRKKEKNEHTT